MADRLLGGICVAPWRHLKTSGGTTDLGTIISAIGLEFGLRTIIEGTIILIALLLLREELFNRIRSIRRKA